MQTVINFMFCYKLKLKLKLLFSTSKKLTYGSDNYVDDVVVIFGKVNSNQG